MSTLSEVEALTLRQGSGQAPSDLRRATCPEGSAESFPHVLNYGMGVESTAILLRWLFEPESRNFPLDRLIVLTAQTGDEFESTKLLVEQYVLPLLRQHRIRYVQLAKHGPLEKDGYTILDDTYEPQEVFTDGDYAMSTQLHEIGTVPMYSAPHTCAMKWKGFVLDCWLRDRLGTEKFGPYLGYNKDEWKRAEKVEEYRCRGNTFLFPLLDWGWSRRRCLSYIRDKLGVTWLKSCCAYCPYIRRETVVSRYLAEPEAAGFTLLTEAIALALNPRMQLFSYGRAYDVVVESGNEAALKNFRDRLAALEWGVYRVERIWERKIGSTSGKPFTRVDRRVMRIAHGSREECSENLHAIAQERGLTVEVSPEAERVYSHKRDKSVSPFDKLRASPSFEGFWVVCPGLVRDKVRNAKGFQQKWEEVTGAVRQLSLF